MGIDARTGAGADVGTTGGRERLHPLLRRSDSAPPPWTPEGLADPHQWFAEALAGDPVLYDARAEIWHVLRYDDVRDVLRDPATWSVAKRMERVPPDQRMVRLLTSDPPLHTELRKHFSDAYRPRRLAGIEPLVRRRVVELVDRALAAGTFDLVSDVAAPLTREVVGELIGVPGDDLETCSRMAIRNPLGTTAADEAGEPYPVLWMGAGEPGNDRHFNAYFGELIDRRRRRPRDDLVSALAAMDLSLADRDGRLNIGALLDEQFGAGQNTTVHLIGTLWAELLARPGQFARLRADRSLVRTAVEEGLRWAAPLQARPRITTRRAAVGGTDVPADAVVLAWTQAANLDPRRFDDPLRFDVARRDNAHLSFGFGAHFCLGAALARLEVRVLLEEWLARVGECARADDGPLQWMDSYMMRGLVRLPLQAAPASAHDRRIAGRGD